MSRTTLPRMDPRALDGHKGDYGHALIIGGARGMTGAVAMAGMACLRSGAGLVSLAVPDVCLDVVASYAPEYMTVGLDSDARGRMKCEAISPLMDLYETATSLAVGPGLGLSDELNQLVASIVANFDKPMVIDADGLNAIASILDDDATCLSAVRGTPVLTPHPGEFRRLLRANRLATADLRMQAPLFAATHGVVLVLKGHHTLITNGDRSIENQTGNPGMATGGAGDVLTGVIAGLLAQGIAPFDAAQLGVHVHGLAGDFAAQSVGQVSLVASDIIRNLPAAFQSLDLPD